MNNYSDNQMMTDIERIIISEEELHEMVARVGAQISRDYNGKNLLMVSVLKGSVMFMADLMRALTIPARIDFMAVSSYGSGTKSSGVVKIAKDLDINLEGYDLLIVEDILDSGKTLFYLRQMLLSRHPKSVKICTLFDKPDRRERRLPPIMWADWSPMNLLWAMAWITMKNTATCPLWGC